MTVLDLVTEIRERLSAYVKLKLPAQHTGLKKVQVYALELPTLEVLDADLYPLVVIELQGVEVNAADEVATLLITCGTYKEEGGGGVLDSWLLAMEVERYLQGHKLIGAASLQPEIEMMAVESDSEYFNFIQLLIRYKIFSIKNEVEEWHMA